MRYSCQIPMSVFADQFQLNPAVLHIVQDRDLLRIRCSKQQSHKKSPRRSWPDPASRRLWGSFRPIWGIEFLRIGRRRPRGQAVSAPVLRWILPGSIKTRRDCGSGGGQYIDYGQRMSNRIHRLARFSLTIELHRT